VASWLGFSIVLPRDATAHTLYFGGLVSKGGGVRNALYLIWATCCWSVWKEHNNHIFKVNTLSKYQMVEAIKMVSWWWLKARKKGFSYDCHRWLLNLVVCLGI
jgi:hypothetical protein